MVRMKKTELTWDKYMDYLIETIDESKFMRRAETKPMSTPKAASESHVTSRATHSKIAANIAKRLADGLDLNGEYIYAGMLMHDAGHPFSAHEGEEIFNKFGKRKNCGFFHHNAKGVEVIRAEGIRDKAISKIPNINENPELREQLETEFDYFLDVIISHDGEATRGERNRKETQYPSMHDAVKDKLKRANSFNDYKFVAQTPEGKLAKMADVIAYLATDIQDGFRIGIIEDFDDDYLALLGEVLTTGYSTREGYITCAKNKIKEVKESKLRELKSEMKKPENEAILANANEIIKRAEQQGVNVTSMRDEELQKIDAIMEQKIQEIKDKSEGMSEEEKQFMYADIEKLKEFVGKMLSVNSSVVQEITSRMREYFINDIVTETRAKTEEKEKTILELREKLALNPGDKELRKQLEDEEKVSDIWFDVYNYYNNKKEWKDKLLKAVNLLEYSGAPEKIKKENIDKLYGNTIKTSVSRLEQYSACPFSYYIKYGLKLSERDIFKIQTIDTGNFMHDVIDDFFGMEEAKDIKNITDEQIEKIVNRIIDQKLELKKNYIFTNVPKNKVLVNRLRRVIAKSMKYIVDSIRYSDFNVLGHEVEFGMGKEYEPIQVKLDNGKLIEIVGKIDRVDIMNNEKEQYIRIIDYKSSIKDIDLNEVKAGIKLQLLTYMNEMCKQESAEPAGAFYYNLIEPMVKASQNMSDEQIEEELRKQFKMRGLILADVDIIRKMDKNLDTGSSNIIPATINKDETLSKKASNISKQQFEYLQKYTNKIIKQISEEILSGNINIKPYYNTKNKKTPCEYCTYKSICQFGNGICKKEYNYISNLEKETILEMMKEK